MAASYSSGTCHKWASSVHSSLAQDQKRQKFRRLEFVPASKVNTSSLQTVTSQAGKRDVSATTQDSGAPKSTSKSSVMTKKSFGLFDPSIITTYTHWNKVNKVGPGFFNDGNSCYLNSTLQCLVHTAPLVQVLQHEATAAMGKLVNLSQHEQQQYAGNRGQKARPVFQLFRNLVTEVWSGSAGRTLSPRVNFHSLSLEAVYLLALLLSVIC